MTHRAVQLGSTAAWALGALVVGACAEPAGDRVDTAAVEARLAAIEERFTPGLHTLMGEVGERHAALWFAGDAENWSLADYQLHELEELIEDIETLHPVYDEIPVAELLDETTAPALAELEATVDGSDRDGFVRAFDQLTQACNSCHIASEREALRIVRPTAPPMTNLEFDP
ncbi:MAG: hypothetical protein U5R14_01225 [Gemmatimonadota bacterium]|nr:hypothetical protein [Gemmatimonadota bacterium]